MFNEARASIKNRSTVDHIDRAINFASVRTMSFSGTGTAYGYWKQGTTPGWNAFLRRVTKLRNRFIKVQIECLDFEKILEKYDSENTFFYLDPPYVDAEHYYKNGFRIEAHKRLAAALKKIKGKFLLSYYPHPVLDELYSGFKKVSKEVVKHSYGSTKFSKRRKKPRAVEMLIRNY